MKLYKWIINLKDHLFFIILLFLSFFLFLFSESTSSKYIQNKILVASSYLGYPIIFYEKYRLISKENEDLSKQLIQKELELSKYYKFKNENIKLKGLLNYQNASSNKLLLSKAISIKHLNASSVMQIDVGYNDSIKINSPIIDVNGLLGKIIFVDKDQSLVQLIYDKNFYVSVVIGEDRALGLFSPSNRYYGVVKGVISSAEINVGDYIYTSEISDIFPPDIPVAKVESINIDGITSLRNISVKILADINNISYVFITSRK